MKLITKNCNMAFRRKKEQILQYKQQQMAGVVTPYTIANGATERLFRSLTAALVVIALGISGYFRRQADRGGEAVATSGSESLAGATARRGGGLGMGVTVLAYLFVPRRVEWAQLPIPQPVRLAGGVLAVSCLPLIYWTFDALGGNVTRTERVRPTAELVTTGPYRWIRHSVYTVGAMFWAGIGLLTANGLLGLWLVLGFLGVAARTPIEERALAEAFGEEYRVYKERTGRYLPRR